MAEEQDKDIISKYYQDLTGSPPLSIHALKPHASDRRIYRLLSGQNSMIGVINGCSAENDAFVYLSNHFGGLGLPVPRIHFFSADRTAYLLDDLGDMTLRDFLESDRRTSGESFSPKVRAVYEQTLVVLPEFQMRAAKNLDFARCFPESVFSARALLLDMEAFSRELVARIVPTFDISTLLPEYELLIQFISTAPSDYFLYRDFQSRNVMIVSGKPYFIDYQGGRRGPLQYDVVSMLYQASAQLTTDVRMSLLDYYLSIATQFTPISKADFMKHYGSFIAARMLQVLGVYGRQGLGAGKEYFRKSIPDALRTLHKTLTSDTVPVVLPALTDCVALLENS